MNLHSVLSVPHTPRPTRRGLPQTATLRFGEQNTLDWPYPVKHLLRSMLFELPHIFEAEAQRAKRKQEYEKKHSILSSIPFASPGAFAAIPVYPNNPYSPIIIGPSPYYQMAKVPKGPMESLDEALDPNRPKPKALDHLLMEMNSLIEKVITGYAELGRVPGYPKSIKSKNLAMLLKPAVDAVVDLDPATKDEFILALALQNKQYNSAYDWLSLVASLAVDHASEDCKRFLLGSQAAADTSPKSPKDYTQKIQDLFGFHPYQVAQLTSGFQALYEDDNMRVARLALKSLS